MMRTELITENTGYRVTSVIEPTKIKTQRLVANLPALGWAFSPEKAAELFLRDAQYSVEASEKENLAKNAILARAQFFLEQRLWEKGDADDND
jgi:hypothetical protein